MRTRGLVYPNTCFSPPPAKKRRTTGKVTAATLPEQQLDSLNCGTSSPVVGAPADRAFAPVCGFDSLHDDLLITIFTKVSSTASSPADLISPMLTCRRFSSVAKHPLVQLNASPWVFSVKASKWSDGAHRFLKQCSDAGNIEASYTLGMIHFYCLKTRGVGASLLAKAAVELHPAALLSLAVIQFNGSGGTRKDKDLTLGFGLCARAATLGYVDAVREIGHCLQDGYGVVRNIPMGRRLLLEANAREAAAAVAASPRVFFETALQMTTRCSVTGCQYHASIEHQTQSEHQKVDLIHKVLVGPTGTLGKPNGHASECLSMYKMLEGGGSFLLSDFGCTVPPAKIPVANKFLVDWFHLNPLTPGLRLCSHSNCGRPETRKHEFRRCSACGSVNYCSRACQALDWKLRHKYECSLVGAWDDWEEHEQDDEEEDGHAMDEREES